MIGEQNPTGVPMEPLLDSRKRGMFIASYMKPFKADGRFANRVVAMQQFVEEVIDYPDRFRPTQLALKSAYAEFILESKTGGPINISDVGTEFPIDRSLIRNMGVGLDFTELSHVPQHNPTLIIAADVLINDQSGWERKESRSMGFVLSEWVEKIPQNANQKS